MFGETEQVLYSLGVQYGKFLITRLNAVNGQVYWNHALSPGSSSVNQAITELWSSGSSSALFVAGPSKKQVIRLKMSDGVVQASDLFLTGNIDSKSYYTKAMYITSADSFLAILTSSPNIMVGNFDLSAFTASIQVVMTPTIYP